MGTFHSWVNTNMFDSWLKKMFFWHLSSVCQYINLLLQNLWTIEIKLDRHVHFIVCTSYGMLWVTSMATTQPNSLFWLVEISMFKTTADTKYSRNVYFNIQRVMTLVPSSWPIWPPAQYLFMPPSRNFIGSMLVSKCCL